LLYGFFADAVFEKNSQNDSNPNLYSRKKPDKALYAVEKQNVDKN